MMKPTDKCCDDCDRLLKNIATNCEKVMRCRFFTCIPLIDPCAAEPSASRKLQATDGGAMGKVRTTNGRQTSEASGQREDQKFVSPANDQ